MFALMGKLLHVGAVFMNAAIGTSFNWKCTPLWHIALAFWLGSNSGALTAFLLVKKLRCRPLASLRRNVSEGSASIRSTRT